MTRFVNQLLGERQVVSLFVLYTIDCYTTFENSSLPAEWDSIKRIKLHHISTCGTKIASDVRGKVYEQEVVIYEKRETSWGKYEVDGVPFVELKYLDSK